MRGDAINSRLVLVTAAATGLIGCGGGGTDDAVRSGIPGADGAVRNAVPGADNLPGARPRTPTLRDPSLAPPPPNSARLARTWSAWQKRRKSPAPSCASVSTWSSSRVRSEVLMDSLVQNFGPRYYQYRATVAQVYEIFTRMQQGEAPAVEELACLG